MAKTRTFKDGTGRSIAEKAIPLKKMRRATLEEEVRAVMRERPELDEAEVEAELIRLRREDR